MKIKPAIVYSLFLIVLLVACSKNYGSNEAQNKITITTSSITGIQYTSALSGGEVTGGTAGAVTEKGICWSTTSVPTIAASKISAGAGTGAFSNTINSLMPGTMYYVRAYATTATETIYGNQQPFTTSAYQLATLSVNPLSSIKQTTAVSGAIISSAGGGTISAKGICWSTNTNPTTTDSKTSDGPGTTTFNTKLTGLTPSTIYYIRAYAVNEAGTAYSAPISFSTLAVSVPSVDDLTVSWLNSNKITCVSNVSEDGGAAVTDRGVCIGLAPNPTITTAGVFPNGPGTGSIVAFISGFTSGTTYYAKAYATNSKGTGYSAEVVFKTP